MNTIKIKSRITPSKYNIYSEVINGKIAVYNTVSQNMQVLDSDFLNNNEESSELLMEGFLVYNNLDEIRRSKKVKEQLQKMSAESLDVVILPTLGCNFKCSYCFNGINHNNSLSESAISKAINFISKSIHKYSDLTIGWHGGEPTLFYKDIIKTNYKIIEIASRFSIKPKIDILTNGSILNDKMLSELLESGLTSLQISVDWPAYKSERKFGNKNGDDTLVKILKNVNLIPNEIEVDLRINLLPDFSSYNNQLIDVLKLNLNRKINIYTHHIVDSTESDNKHTTSNILEFRKEQYSLKKLLRENDFYQAYYPEEIETGDCIANKTSGFVFTSQENIGKCYAEVDGNHRAEVNDKGEYNKLAKKYLEWTGDNINECQSCSYLPICDGGCPKQGVENPLNIEERCTPWKFTLEKELTSYLLNN